MSAVDSEEPVIILTPGSEAINLDPLPGLSPTTTTSTTTPQASPSESMRQTASNAVLEAVKISLVNWKDDRFKTIRPFGEFFDKTKLSFPKPTDVLTRMKNNLSYYQTNYIIVFFILSIYSALTSPTFLISLLAVGALWVWSLKQNNPFTIQGKQISQRATTTILLIISLIIFYICSTTTVLIWLMTATVCFVLGHSLFMTPQAVDEFGFGVLPPLGQPEANFAQIPTI
eukprot:TRINITY_DN2348_c0_g1_i1.p1 TRINITY_DN2348_c0_g1~~TRINITY_DN2348_c0_g1_i1.p1  ORF type:complete len:244 (-),score=42.52 TRINITY_DN2348_c0_g1_i1:266-952(-)